MVRAWCFFVFLQSPPFSVLHAQSVLTYLAKAKITITNAQCTSTTKLSMVCLLLIKGHRFRSTKTKTSFSYYENEDPRSSFSHYENEDPTLAKRTAYFITRIFQQTSLLHCYNLF